MFVYSFKASKRQIISMILCAVMLIAVLVLRYYGRSERVGRDICRLTEATMTKGQLFKNLGYDIDSQSPTVRKCLFPMSLTRFSRV